MKSFFLISFLLLAGPLAQANTSAKTSTASNTFVGNGGNAGDLELQMTLGQITRTSQLIVNSETDDDLCVCPPEYRNRAICEPLKELTDEQKLYCQKTIRTKAAELLQLLSSGTIKWDWSDHKMSVEEKGGQRDSDAVANSDDSRITIVRDPFISHKPPERVFLTTHELLHLTKTDGVFMQDEEPIGPFKERDGGRHLLNALGTAMAMFAQTKRVYLADRRADRRSKNYVKNWFSLSFGGRSPDQSSTFALDSVNGGALDYRRKFNDDWGVFLRYRYFGGKQSVLTSTTTKVSENAIALGVDRQFTFFRDPMTYWGQSFFLVGLGAEYLNGSYTVADDFVTVDDSVNSFAALARAQYFIPIMVGFWGFAEVSATNFNYAYNDVNVKSSAVQSQFYLGVSYGF